MTVFDTLDPIRRSLAVAILVGGLVCLFLIAIEPGQISNSHSHVVPAASSARPATIVRPLSCEELADVPGKAVTTAKITFPPNAYTPAHRHPGSVTAYVLTGAVRSQLSGGPAIDYTAGQTWFEPAGALHLFAENASATEPAEILAIFVADENCGPLVIPEP